MRPGMYGWSASGGRRQQAAMSVVGRIMGWQWHACACCHRSRLSAREARNGSGTAGPLADGGCANPPSWTEHVRTHPVARSGLAAARGC